VIYLSGCFRPEFLGEPGLGWLFQPSMGNNPNLHGSPWAIDTGLFNKNIEHLFVNNRKSFRDRYVRYLESRQKQQATCLFATAPDKVGDALASLLRALSWFSTIRDLGYRVAFVGQDGAESMVHMLPWDSFDVLFLGGSTRWKESPSGAGALAAAALVRGKHVHMGRVNSARRWRIAKSFGCSSADGTVLAYGPDKMFLYVKAWLTWDRENNNA